jgi:DNA-binding helix-hairpin-helix protein with protein kinase domain
MKLFAGRGQVVLGRELARGGEGAIHEVANQPDELAKLYLKPPSPDHARKLHAMVGLQSTALRALAAWPSEVLVDRDRAPRGFLMPRVHAAHDVHQLYGPGSRRRYFPSADFRFLFRAAANTARAFAAIHTVGAVIGDVNHGMVLVRQDATVTLVDCDSFQLVAGGTVHRCVVGTPDFTPPELYGANLRQVARTPDHDAFGLAVLLFRLLMMARHPFAGIYSGTGDMPIELAIPQHRYAYSTDTARTLMRPPPGVPPVRVASAPVAALWEHAFSPEGARRGRPSAADWVAALTRAEKQLTRCSASEAHYFHPDAAGCPWCPLERVTGLPFFPVTSATPISHGQGGMSIEALWERIQRITPPPTLHEPSVPTDMAPSPGAVRDASSERAFVTVRTVIGGAVALGGFIAAPAATLLWIGLGFFVAHLLKDHMGCTINRKPYRDRLSRAEAVERDLRAQWQAASPAAFEAEKNRLAARKREADRLPERRRQLMEQLQRNREALAKRAFLEQFDIEDAKIPGIGPGRVATLASFGIETAADVTAKAILGIRGFGPAMANRLVEWRRTKERGFRFDPATPIPPGEIARVDATLAAERRDIANDLTRGHAMLSHLATTATQASAHLRPVLDAACRELAQARADLRALG